MADEITKYQKEWDEYKDRKADNFLFGVVLVICFIAAAILAGNFPQYEKAVFIGFFLIIGAFIVFYVYRYVFGKVWMCPRCQELYDYPRRRVKDVSNCRNCNLPIYYGSSYFYDRWGTEQGEKLAKQISEGRL